MQLKVFHSKVSLVKKNLISPSVSWVAFHFLKLSEAYDLKSEKWLVS